MPEKSSYDQGQFSWVDLMSHGMDQAKSFYGNVFGWSVSDMDTQGGPPYAEFRLEGKGIGGLGEASDEMKAQGVPPMWNSYINVVDVEAVIARAKELGATVTVPPVKVFDAGWLAFFSDPTGGNVGLWQANDHKGATVVNEPGSLCWNELLTRDIEKAKEFYGQLLGWEFDVHEGSPSQYYIIKNKGGMNGGLMQMTEEFGDAPPHWMVYFAVSDTDATAKTVTDTGGKVVVPPFDTPVGRISAVADPQGAHFSLIQLAQQP